MRNFFFTALFSVICVCAYSQDHKAEKIVKEALKKMSGGKTLRSFHLATSFDSPGEIPPELKQPGFFENFMDSILPTLSDSMRTAINKEYDRVKKQSFQDRLSSTLGERQYLVADFIGQQAALTTIRFNAWAGVADSTRSVYHGNFGSFFATVCKNAPVALLQIMSSDSAELHYSGTTIVNGIENHIVQIKIDKSWIDVYIEKLSLLVNRIQEQKINEDPLLGKGPEEYKTITVYSEYRDVDGFLFPLKLELMSSFDDLTTRQLLSWSHINKQFDRTVFNTQPARNEQVVVTPIDDSLFVMVLTGRRPELRSLIRLTQDDRIDCFMETVNHEHEVRKMVSALEIEFPKKSIRDLYCLDNVTWISSFNAFFDLQATVIVPMGIGRFSEERVFLYSPVEDSLWRARKTANILKTFDSDFQKNGVQCFILNPNITSEWETYSICYYLPAQKLVFFNGNPYIANLGADHIGITEKRLYDFLEAKRLDVEKIIFSEAYVSGSPLEMSFKELDRRVRNTDFSKYDKLPQK